MWTISIKEEGLDWIKDIGGVIRCVCARACMFGISVQENECICVRLDKFWMSNLNHIFKFLIGQTKWWVDQKKKCEWVLYSAK